MPALTRLLILTFLLALALAPTAAARGSAFDYMANAKHLSKPTYATEKVKLTLPAFDGAQLYIEVTKPKKAGRWPVVLEASPYHGTLADREGTRILPDPRDEEGNSIGLTGYFAPRGYAVVMMDLRGTGRSGGCLDHLGPKDARDLEQVVEWAASRAWSNGRVGMTGHSYVGSTPSAAAAQNPKGLATIVPSAGLASMYHHQFQGGVPYFLQWAGPQWAYNYLTVARHLPPVGKEPVQRANTGDDFGSSNTANTGCGMPNSALTAGEDQFSGRYVKWHLERDWNKGATRADIPVFAVHGINDNAARVPALDWFFDRRNKQDKLWLGQWDHGSGCCPNRRGLQWTYALHAWFEKHLMRRNVRTGPDMELFLADDQSFSAVQEGARTEVLTGANWPLAKETLDFFPSGNGTMSERRGAAGDGSRSFTGTKQGFSEFIFVDPTWKTGTSFVTEPFKRDVLMAGLPKLELHASVTAPRVHLIANLLDEDPEGKRRRLSQFAINPELRDGVATRSTVVPGQRYELEPPPMAMAHRLRRGHRLVLQVTTSDADKVAMFSEDPRVTVYTGRDATKVTVPVYRGRPPVADNVPLQVQKAFTKPAHQPIEATVTTGPPGADARPLVGTEYVEFELLDGEDNARAEAVAVPDQQADIDLYLQRQAADGSWDEVDGSSNGADLEKEAVSWPQRLDAGKYRLVVHNYLGPPGNDVAVKLTFFDTRGQAG